RLCGCGWPWFRPARTSWSRSRLRRAWRPVPGRRREPRPNAVLSSLQPSFLSAAPAAAWRRSLIASPEEHGPILPLDLDLEAVIPGRSLARGEAQNVFVTQVLDDRGQGLPEVVGSGEGIIAPSGLVGQQVQHVGVPVDLLAVRSHLVGAPRLEPEDI